MSFTVDVKSLESHLNSLASSSDVVRHRKALKVALQHASASQQLLPSVAKFLSSLDIVAKKLASWFISHHRNQPDLLILAVNSLTKDCSSPNPQVRCLALKTLTFLPHSDFVEYSLQAILKGLGDDSAYVRRAAVVACTKLNRLNPEYLEDSGIIDTLYAMIRDRDPVVVVNVLQVLDEILEIEGGVVVNKNIAYYLLNHLEIFSNWEVPIVVNVLKKYQPKLEEEVYDVMNVLDAHLQKGSASTVVELCRYFVKLTSDLPQVQESVMKRVKVPLLHSLKSSNPELTAVLIDCIESLFIPKFIQELQSCYTSFLCKQKEPSFLKVKRIHILAQLITEENVTEIVDEMIIYSATSIDVSDCVIEGIFKISQTSEDFHSLCVEKLINVLDTGTQQVKSQTFTVLSKMNLASLSKSPGQQQKLLAHIGDVLLLEQDTATLKSLLLMIGECGQVSDDLPYLLEEFVGEFSLWDSQNLSEALIVACVKLLLKRPAEYQALAGEVMETAYEEGTKGTKECVVYYYKLLKQDITLVKSAIL